MNRANMLLIDYSFHKLGLEVGAGLVEVVDIFMAARQIFQELLVARAGYLFLKWSVDP
jgi:hypothetical protein